MEFLMERKGESYGWLLFILKFVVLKTGVKIMCHMGLISTIYCVTEMISTHCDISGD